MSSLLYYSTSAGLTEAEKIEIEIDRAVSKNLEGLCISVKKLGPNVNNKKKKVILIIALASGISFSKLESAEAICLTIPTPAIVRVQASYQPDSKVELARLVPKKTDRITYNRSLNEILPLIYLTDPRLSSNIKIIERISRRELESSSKRSHNRIDNFNIINGRRFCT